MSALRVTLEPVTRKRVAPGDAAIEVVVVNSGDKPEFFHEYQAQHASLVLQLEDPSGKRLLLPPPPPPDERDFWSPVELRAGAVDQAPLCWVGRCPPGIRPLSRSLVLARRGARWLARSAAGERVDRLGGWPLGGIAIASSVVSVGRPRVRGVATGTVSALIVVRDILRLLCRAVLGQEVDLQMTETISNATPSAWNGTYAWNARFHVQVDQAEAAHRRDDPDSPERNQRGVGGGVDEHGRGRVE